MEQAELGGSETLTGQGTGPRTNRSLCQEGASEQGHHPWELRLLLLGKHGAGKSATGNTILGKAVFTSKFSEQMVTNMCQTESRDMKGEKIVVIDTPDLFSSRACTKARRHNTENCLELSAPILHVLLLVIPIGFYTVEDRETSKGIEEVFGAEARRHTIVLFTRRDDLGDDSIQDYIENDKSLRELVQNYEGRYCAFNNKAGEDKRDSQVRELLYMVQCLVKNRGPHHVNSRNEGSGFQDRVNEATSQKGNNPHDLPHRHGVTVHTDSALDDSDSVNIPVVGPGEQQLQATGYEQNLGTSELKVLLVGKRGVGKSAAGNSLLGMRVFETKFSEQSVTQRFRSESRIWRERKILIIDSPDLSSSKDFKSELWRHTSLGPYAFLLVTPLGSFTEQDKAVLSTLQSSFGDKFFEHMIILFTRKEDLGDQEVDMFLKTGDKAVYELIEKCQNRYSVFNYRATAEEEQRQVDELLQKLVSMVQRNEDKTCTLSRKKETLNMVLVGRSGTGKSATGNTILGSSEFLSQLQAQPVTKSFQKGKRARLGQDVVVVDTPALCLMLGAEGYPSQIEELKSCVSDCEDGKTVLVLVLQLGRFIHEDKKVVEMLETIFGEDVMKFTIVLFTRKEDLGDGNLDDYIKNIDNKAIRKIIKKCRGRVYAFNNRETGQARENQVIGLLKMANELISSHGGHGFSHARENVSTTKNAQEKHKSR